MSSPPEKTRYTSGNSRRSKELEIAREEHFQRAGKGGDAGNRSAVLAVAVGCVAGGRRWRRTAEALRKEVAEVIDVDLQMAQGPSPLAAAAANSSNMTTLPDLGSRGTCRLRYAP